MTLRNRLNKDGTDPYGTSPFPMTVAGPAGRGVEGKRKKRYIKPAAYGTCPKCRKGQVALMRQGKHLVWKEHDFATYGHSRFACQASGQLYCELPERADMPLNASFFGCPCGRKPERK